MDGDLVLSTLEQAARVAGTWAALSRVLGVPESTLRGWRRRGVPAARVAQVEGYLAAPTAAPPPAPRTKRAPKGPKVAPELRTAKRLAGSWRGVAKALGVAPRTVEGWRQRGLPKGRAEALAAYAAERRAAPRKRKPAAKRPPKSPELEAALQAAGGAKVLGELMVAPVEEVRAWRKTGEIPEAFRVALGEYLGAVAKFKAAIKSPKDELAKALRMSGSLEAFAIRYGIKSVRTIKRWQKEGPSKRALNLLMQYRLERQSEREVNKISRTRLDILLGFTTAAEEKLLAVKSSSARREGELTEGWRWTKRWVRTLTYSLIDDIFSWYVSHKRQNGRWSFWHGAMLSIQYDPEGKQGPVGMGKKTDYVILGVRELNVTAANSQEKVKDFIIPMTHGTPRRTTAMAIGEYMRDLLVKILESGNEAHIISTTLYNYRVRSDNERRERAAERARAWRERRKHPERASRR